MLSASAVSPRDRTTTSSISQSGESNLSQPMPTLQPRVDAASPSAPTCHRPISAPAAMPCRPRPPLPIGSPGPCRRSCPTIFPRSRLPETEPPPCPPSRTSPRSAPKLGTPIPIIDCSQPRLAVVPTLAAVGNAQRLPPHHRERRVALHHRPPLRRDGAGDRRGQRLLLARQDLSSARRSSSPAAPISSPPRARVDPGRDGRRRADRRARRDPGRACRDHRGDRQPEPPQRHRARRRCRPGPADCGPGRRPPSSRSSRAPTSSAGR